MKSDISCVLVHKGYKPYLKYNLEITSKNNKIYLIGDKSLERLQNISKNITYIDISKYENSKKIAEYKNSFINYSTNSFDFEWFCFARVFIIQSFIKEKNLENIFYIDSDNVLLENINNLSFTNTNAFMIPYYQDSFRMSASIHSSLLSSEFCDQFENLYNDLYVSRAKFNLIEGKIDYHEKNNIMGGICDMTLYYLLYKNDYLSIQNLFDKFQNKFSENVVFMNHINTGEGPYSKENYELKNGKLKIFKGNKIHDLVNNEKLKVCNVHYQGSAKKFLNRYTKFRLRY